MYILKSSGDIGCPCSVPMVISMVSDNLWISLIRVTELLYMFWRQEKKLPPIPSLLSLYMRASLQTVSNALR